MTKEDWEHMKPKFNCPFGVTNVWTTAQLRNSERIKKGLKAVHLNQKPLELIGRIIEMSSFLSDDISIMNPYASYLLFTFLYF